MLSGAQPCLAIAMLGVLLAACSGRPSPQQSHASSTNTKIASTTTHIASSLGQPAGGRSGAFTPPPESAIPDDSLGAMVREGEQIFTHTQQYAGTYIGNGLNCSDCHLDAGRQPDSAPLWAAYVRYPRYRSKNHKVNSYADRLEGCFRFSMNGTPPPADSTVIRALTAYSYWLATGAPTGENLAGAGYPDPGKPAQAPSFERGRAVYSKDCSLCHGDRGQGQKALGKYVFPPLWGPASFNWGAGMARINTAAAFIRANMPFSLGGTLSAQQAWDVALYVDSHERPQDPRFTGNIATTRKKYHDSAWSMYGKTVNGHRLGSASLIHRK